MINLERYLLEIVAFDFRCRNSAELLAALCVELKLPNSTAKVAFEVCKDGYRTLAVLKQTRQTMAFAAIELAARFLDIPEEIAKAVDESLFYKKLGTTRNEVVGKSILISIPSSKADRNAQKPSSTSYTCT